MVFKHDYKEFVNKDRIVFDGDIRNNYRYSLKVPLKNKGNRKVLIIMKNPSKANQYVSDHSVNRVLTFCNNAGYSEVNIVNLFSYYSTDSKKISELIKNGQVDIAIGKDNDKTIKMLVKESDDIIVAWGSNTFGCTNEYKRELCKL